MTSLTGPDLLASWLWRSIRDPGVPGSIPGWGTRREYFLYRSISPPTTPDYAKKPVLSNVDIKCSAGAKPANSQSWIQALSQHHSIRINKH